MTGAQHQFPLPLPSAEPPARRRRIDRDRDRHISPEQRAAFDRHKEQQQGRAGWPWSKRQPIDDSPVERYLIDECRITCALPPTIAYLPPQDGYPHALIAAFGLTDESEPGVLAEPCDVAAVLVTALKADGSPMRGPRARLLLGQELGTPIVCGAINDGGGLAIAVKPEDALAVHQATGLGAWAAGHASRLPALAHAVPAYVTAVTLLARRGSAAEAGAQLFIKIFERGERPGVEINVQESPR